MWKLETVKQVVQHWDQKKKIKMQGMQKNEKKKKKPTKEKKSWFYITCYTSIVNNFAWLNLKCSHRM